MPFSHMTMDALQVYIGLVLILCACLGLSCLVVGFTSRRGGRR